MARHRAEQLSEKRQHVRCALTGEIPGTLTSERGEDFEFVSVDITTCGLGLLLEPSPDVGEVLTLTLHINTPLVLRFEVRWSALQHEFNEVPELKNMRRCGLMLLTRGVDLRAVFAALDGITIEE